MPDVAYRDLAYVALGSNLGDRPANLAFARAELAALPRSRLRGLSSIEETEPLGSVDQPPYLNQMAVLETDLEPHELLDALQAIEQRAGRVRNVRWGARTLDLDIVLFGQRSVATDRLVIPHPELARREFWQRELSELRTEF
jgi:2-amino-4-hydroxy-6-hydroxymethyldihydropteridine diphosphokinase